MASKPSGGEWESGRGLNPKLRSSPRRNYDGWRVMEEHDGSDNDHRQYTYGPYPDENVS